MGGVILQYYCLLGGSENGFFGLFLNFFASSWRHGDQGISGEAIERGFV